MGKHKNKHADSGSAVFAAYMAAIPDSSSGDTVGGMPATYLPLPSHACFPETQPVTFKLTLQCQWVTCLSQILCEHQHSSSKLVKNVLGRTMKSTRTFKRSVTTAFTLQVRDLRVLSYQSWKTISLLPIVKDLLQQAVWRGVPSQKELKKRNKKEKKEKKYKKNKYKHSNHDDSAQGDALSLDIDQQQQPPPVMGDMPAVEQGVADMIIAYEITPDVNPKPVSESGELPRRPLVPVIEYVRKKTPRRPPTSFVQPPVPSPSSSSAGSSDSDSDSDSSAAVPTKTTQFGLATTGMTPSTILPTRRILPHPSNPSRLRVTTATGGQYEVDRYCPHKSADLATWGALVGSNLVCNKHAWSFNLENGGICTRQGKGINACRVQEW
ncbi:hypothetical protein BC937DRAFT_87669 [Endogone sp. FLAS-F59071]|nr:hypothetical protein BC937DRAFT_87669 [Endogone sp. FLAS-F59071]|eukprot:RUS19321.1 hypothetical protein BC937DRAFT_87669 [Endogone sp. FLAS-F59071]